MAPSIIAWNGYSLSKFLLLTLGVLVVSYVIRSIAVFRGVEEIDITYAKTFDQLKTLALQRNTVFNTGIDVYADGICKERPTVVDLSLLKSDFERNIEEVIQELNGTVFFSKTDFHNWAYTQNATQVWTAHPRNLEEIQKLVKSCNKHLVKVRCVGSGHSWAPIFPDFDSIFVYMDLLSIEPNITFSDDTNTTVDIFAGATTDDFKRFQLVNKVSLPCNVILEVVQMVSVVATGCHGVGKNCLTPSDYVEKIRIVNSNGDLVTYTKVQYGEDMMKAVTASFGLFGIIYDMTIKVEPQIIVNMENRFLPMKDYFDTDPSLLKRLVNDYWSVEIFWFPYGSTNLLGKYDPMKEEVYARVANTTTESNDIKPDDYYEKTKIKDLWSSLTQAIINKYMVAYPILTPYFGHFGAYIIKHLLYPAETIQQELPHAVHFRKFIEWNPVFDLEFAFAISDDNFGRVLEIIHVVFDEMKGKTYPLNIAMEMRFMKFSTSYLCPAKIGDPSIGGTGKVFYIEILSAAKTKGWNQFSVNVADKWFALGGIPHLAKEWPIIPHNYDKVRKVLRQPIADFTKKLEESQADPNHIFFNAHLQKLLYGTEA